MLKKMDYSFVFVAALSLFLCGLLWYWNSISFNSDSEQYLRTAFALIHRHGEFYYYRTWGYPIILNLLGVTLGHTFFWLLLVQSLLGAAIPVLIYKTILPVNKKAALILAVASALSLAPYIWQKVVMTDQVSMFFYYLLAYATSRYIYNQSSQNLRFIGIVGFCLFLMRPSAMLLYFCTMAGLLVFHRQAWRQILIAVTVFVSATLLFQAVQNHIVHKYVKRHHMNKTFTKGSMVGKMFFFNVYAVGPYYTGGLTIDPANGKYSAKLYNDLVTWGIKNPEGTNSYFGIKGGTEFADKLFKDPNLFTHSVMWLAMDQTVGGAISDGIFARAAFEGIAKHPKTLMIFLNGFVQFFMSGDVAYNVHNRGGMTIEQVNTISASIPTAPFVSNDGRFPKKLQKQLLVKEDHWYNISKSKSVYEFLFYWQTLIKVIATLIAVLLFPACLFCGRHLACLASITFLWLFYQAAVAVVFAEPHFRYTSPQIPLIIMLAGMGIFAVNMLRQKRASSNS